MVSHALSPVGSDLKAYILEAAKAWYSEHEFYDRMCDICCVLHNDNFLTRGCNKNQI